MWEVIFHTIRNCSLGEVSILKRDIIEENHCLIRLSVFDVRITFSVLATPLKCQTIGLVLKQNF